MKTGRLISTGLIDAGLGRYLRNLRFGLIAKRTGSVMFRGEEILSKAPHIRFHRGLGYVPEDRRVVAGLTVRENLRLGLIAAPNRTREAEAIDRIAETFPRLKERLDQRHRHQAQPEIAGEGAILRPRRMTVPAVTSRRINMTQRRDRTEKLNLRLSRAAAIGIPHVGCASALADEARAAAIRAARGGLTVCGTRWACASEVAIREAMAALYHAPGTSRILEGFGACRGLVEPREGIGCRLRHPLIFLLYRHLRR